MFKFCQRFTRVHPSAFFHQSRLISTVKVQTLCDRQQNRGIRIIKAKTDDSVRRASQLMESNKIGALMVEDADERIVGILTARDVQSAVALNDTLSHLKAQFSILCLFYNLRTVCTVCFPSPTETS